MIKKSVLIILPAKEFNEQEFLVISHELLKAGNKIFIASDAYSLCIGSGGLKVKNDMNFYNINENNFDGVILIGGKGVLNYWNNSRLHVIVKRFNEKKKIIGAICSAPVILAKAGLLNGMGVCYHEDKDEFIAEGVEYINKPIVINKNIITGRDPSASKEFVDLFNHLIKNS